tara:strand:+ start:505 stop:636 length:132 start_codon:yes stop_codon:yes gene_type:complete
MKKTLKITQETHSKLLELKADEIRKQGNSVTFSDIIEGLMDDS